MPTSIRHYVTAAAIIAAFMVAALTLHGEPQRPATPTVSAVPFNVKTLDGGRWVYVTFQDEREFAFKPDQVVFISYATKDMAALSGLPHANVTLGMMAGTQRLDLPDLDAGLADDLFRAVFKESRQPAGEQ